MVKWAHERPDGSQWYTVDENLLYGENLAKGQSTPEDAVAAWMASDGHRKNILNAGYKTMGVACYYCNGKYYWAQEFGY